MHMNDKKISKIWIDLDNSPHVPFFRPIINELNHRGFEVVITSRDCFETTKLLKLFYIPHKNIGKHYGKKMLSKLYGTIFRSLQLYYFIRKQKPNLAISLGSRSQIFTAVFLLNIPVVHIFDYEHATGFPPFLIRKFIVPEFIIDDVFVEKKYDLRKIYKFQGIKEDIYLNEFEPDTNSLSFLSLHESKVIVVLRPPASTAHYHNPKSDKIYLALLKKFAKNKNVQLIILPRTNEQKKIALRIFKSGVGTLTIPDHVVDGLNLLWKSDLVISGGGTMVREAAGLGIPAYSTFCGKTGCVDKYLQSQKRITLIQDEKDIQKIELIKRNKYSSFIRKNNIVLKITDEILNVIE